MTKDGVGCSSLGKCQYNGRRQGRVNAGHPKQVVLGEKRGLHQKPGDSGTPKEEVKPLTFMEV